MMKMRFAATALAVSTLALASCAKKAPQELPPPPEQPAAETPTPPPPPSGPAVGSQEHFDNAIGLDNTVVYFDTDKSDIDATDAAKLKLQAAYFQQHPNLNFTIEGNCDERGTREYNLALGERRATAAKNYLVSLGISPDRIRTVSYGKERPVALGSTPEDWAKNRRDATVIIN